METKSIASLIWRFIGFFTTLAFGLLFVLTLVSLFQMSNEISDSMMNILRASPMFAPYFWMSLIATIIGIAIMYFSRSLGEKISKGL